MEGLQVGVPLELHHLNSGLFWADGFMSKSDVWFRFPMLLASGKELPVISLLLLLVSSGCRCSKGKEEEEGAVG